MATTIITKFGSGAPAASDVVRGELAVDTENGRLYTETSGGAVIEIGLNPSGNVDVTGTVTADGLTLGSEGDQISIPTSAGFSGIITTGDSISGNAFEFKNGNGIAIVSDTNDSGVTGGVDATLIARGSSATKTALFDANGDISFYEDTGTDAKFFWDASTERLGIGNSSPATALDVTGTVTADGLTVESSGDPTSITLRHTGNTSGFVIKNFSGAESQLVNVDNGPMVFKTNDTEAMRITSSGNVGIGTSSPQQKMHVVGGGLQITGNITTPASGQTGVLIDYASDGARFWSRGTASARGTFSFIQLENDGGNQQTAMSIDASGNVGIGTSSPVGKLSIEVDNSTVYSASNMFDSGISQYIFNTSQTDGTAVTIGLGLNGTSTDGQAAISAVYTSAGNGALCFGTRAGGNVVERVRIDSSGNLLVGKTSLDVGTVGQELRASGYMAATRDGSTVGSYTRLNSDGTILEFRKDSAAVGSIGTTAGDIQIGSGDTALRFQASTDSVFPAQASGGGRGSAIDLGLSSVPFKDLYLSGGLYVGGTGSANYLDDYEEGTWTPAVNAGAISGTSIAYSGTYTKIGRLVLVHFKASNTTGDIQVSSYVTFSGFPFNINETCSSTVVTEDIDQFSRLGFAAASGTVVTLSACGSSTGTTSLFASIAAYI